MAHEERPNSLIGLSEYLVTPPEKVSESILNASQRILSTSRTAGIEDYKKEVRRLIDQAEEQRNRISMDEANSLLWLQAKLEGMKEVERVFSSLPEEAQEQIDLYLNRKK